MLVDLWFLFGIPSLECSAAQKNSGEVHSCRIFLRDQVCVTFLQKNKNKYNLLFYRWALKNSSPDLLKCKSRLAMANALFITLVKQIFKAEHEDWSLIQSSISDSIQLILTKPEQISFYLGQKPRVSWKGANTSSSVLTLGPVVAVSANTVLHQTTQTHPRKLPCRLLLGHVCCLLPAHRLRGIHAKLFTHPTQTTVHWLYGWIHFPCNHTPLLGDDDEKRPIF